MSQVRAEFVKLYFTGELFWLGRS